MKTFSTLPANLHLSPDGSDASGGNGGGALPVGGPASGGAPAFDPTKYVPVESYRNLETRFNGVTTKLSEYDRRFADYEKRIPKPETPRNQDLRSPDMADYDFDRDPRAFNRYLDDRDAYREQERSKREQATTREREAREVPLQRVQETMDEFKRAERTYARANPSYYEDFNRMGGDALPDEVKFAIMGRRDGPKLTHAIAKDPNLLAEVIDAFEDDGVEGVIEVLGAVRSKWKAEASGTNTGRFQRPQRVANTGSFSAGGRGGRAKTKEEIFQSFNS